MLTKLKLKPKSEFSRNVLTLMTGTSIAQAIPIAISPILTRIYTPEDFGLFALYGGILMILSVMATGKYELAITIPKNNIEAKNIVILSITISIVLSILTLLLLFIFSNNFTDLLKNEYLENLLFLLPVSILSVGFYQSMSYYTNRESKFKRLAVSKVVQSLSVASISLFFGYIVYLDYGMILGSVFGQLVATIVLVKLVLDDNKNFLKNISLKRIFVVAKKNIKFPKILVASNFINTFSQQLPIFLFGIYYSSAVVGYYMLSQRIVKMPSSILANAVADVFRQKASYEFSHNGNCFLLYKQTVKKLFFISAIPFSILFLISPDLFSFIFGEKWRITGEYVQIMIPMFFLQFISNPLSMLTVIANKQEYDIWWQSMFGIGTLIILLGTHYVNDNIKNTLMYLTVFYTFMYIIMLYITYKLSKNDYNQIVKR
jgi:O-antigen/teichoic acid export membrane protein